jgi:predicted nucleic acid-binding protein
MELIQGMRNRHELNVFRKQFRKWNAKIAYINEEISTKAMFYVERNYLNHSLELADSLIGSTAIVYGLPLVTCNEKHYKIIKELELIKFNSK